MNTIKIMDWDELEDRQPKHVLISNVDLVVIFSEDTPANIIKTLKPEVLVKGADYKVEDIPEAAIVRAYGGKIHLAKLEKGHSTTPTIAKMAK